MELSALIQRQISADRRRGFSVDFASASERLDQLERDLIGLVGEVGEFANILKKIRLHDANAKYDGPSLDLVSSTMREELADVAIYLMRLSTLLGGDLEADIIEKMRLNDERYGKLE